MLPDSAFSGKLPLDRDACLELLANPNKYRTRGGVFLTFVKIPTDARTGDWCFAGVRHTLAAASELVEDYIAPLGGKAEDGSKLLEYLLEPTVYEEGWHFPKQAPIEGLGPHRLVLCVQADAPHDNTGVCIVEFPAPSADSSRQLDEEVLARWREEAITRMMELGTRRWGPPASTVRAVLEKQSTPDDWVRWSQSEWGDWPNWSLDDTRNGPVGWDDLLRPDL